MQSNNQPTQQLHNLQTSISTRPPNNPTTINACPRDNSPISTRIILTNCLFPYQQQQKTRAGLKAYQNALLAPPAPQPSKKENEINKEKMSIENTNPNNSSCQTVPTRKRKRDNVVYSLDEQNNFSRGNIDTNIRLVKSNTKKQQKVAKKEIEKIKDYFDNYHAKNVSPSSAQNHYCPCSRAANNSQQQAATATIKPNQKNNQEKLEFFQINEVEYPIGDLYFKEIKKDKVTSLQLKKKQGKKPRKPLNIVYKLVKHNQPNVNEKNLVKQCEWLRNEHVIISQLNHPNIMKSLGFFPNVIVNNESQCGMLMQEANQDLKKLVNDIEQHKLKSHNLSLRDIKNVFASIIEPISYLHSFGLAHNDLKMDNYFAFKINNQKRYKKIEDYMFKLADFEMSRHRTQIKSYKDLQYYWKLVNISYSGPEVYELLYLNRQTKFDEQKNDIFQLGLILFKMLFKNQKPQVNYNSNQKVAFLHFQNDPIYRHMINQNYKAFWNCEIDDSYYSCYEEVQGKATKQRIQQRSCRLKETIETQFYNFLEQDPTYFNQQKENIKDLINKMLAYNPVNRPSIEEIKNHPFMLV